MDIRVRSRSPLLKFSKMVISNHFLTSSILMEAKIHIELTPIWWRVLNDSWLLRFQHFLFFKYGSYYRKKTFFVLKLTVLKKYDPPLGSNKGFPQQMSWIWMILRNFLVFKEINIRSPSVDFHDPPSIIAVHTRGGEGTVLVEPFLGGKWWREVSS